VKESLERNNKIAIYEWDAHPLFLAIIKEQIIFNAAWLAWVKDPCEPFPLGAISITVMEYLGTALSIVHLSKSTYAKQLDHHPELLPAHYAVIPTIFKDGEAYEQDETNKIRLVWEVGSAGFEVDVKATRKGELFLASFFRAKRGRIEKTRRNYRRVH
jgi:hypothetical protein